MKWKILLGAFLGLFLNKWLPYASTVSTAIIVVLLGHAVIRMAKPGPPHSFLWGHLRYIGERIKKEGDTPEVFILMARDYAPDGILFLDLWPVVTPMCMIFDEGVANKVLTVDNLPKAIEAYVKLKPVMGSNSMITLEGEHWHKLRKMFNPAFSQGHLEKLVPGIVDETLNFVEILTEATNVDKDFLMLDALTLLTLDIIGRVTLGEEFHAQGRQKTGPLITAFQVVIDQIPAGNELGDVLQYFNPPQIYRRYRAEKALDNEIASIVRFRQQSAKLNDGKRVEYRTVLDLALQDEEYGSLATLTELVDQMKTFLFAGHDTSASMLAWAYYYLSSHPDSHAKLKAEHDVVFGTDTNPDHIAQKIKNNPSVLGKLEYTLAVLKESLRLRPIADGVRYAPPGYTIHTATGADFDTSGTILNVQHGGLHTREEIWGDTATEFDPERFMGGKTVPIGYMPFATRPRDCIGRNLAYLEGKIVLALTIRSFEFGRVKELQQVYKGTKKPSDGAPMRVTRCVNNN